MTEQTDTPAALTAAEIAAIAERLARIPGGDWHSALGSGHNAMTAVMADVPDGDDDYEPVFICDVIPDFRVEDPQVWENRVPLLEFIAHAPADIAALLATVARQETTINDLRAFIAEQQPLFERRGEIIEERRIYVAQQEARITELAGLLREAHGHLSIGLDVYDEIADALALPPATEEGGTTDE